MSPSRVTAPFFLWAGLQPCAAFLTLPSWLIVGHSCSRSERRICVFSGSAASPFVGIAFVVGTVTSLRRWFALHCAVFFGRLFVAVSLAERASSPFVKWRACLIPRPSPSRVVTSLLWWELCGDTRSVASDFLTTVALLSLDVAREKGRISSGASHDACAHLA